MEKASSLLENKDFPNAIKSFDTVLKIDEKFVDAICSKGIALMGLG